MRYAEKPRVTERNGSKMQNLDLLEPHSLVPPGVFTLDGLLKYGEENKQCPYFSARRMVLYHCPYTELLLNYGRCRSAT